jgi:glycosyltransferase involved in cell wall biosynthesis
LRGGVDPGFGQAVTWNVDLLAGYPSIFLGPRGHTGPDGFWSLTCPKIWSEIRNGHYDAVWLYGYNYAANLIAFAAAKTKGLPVLMRCETHSGLRRSALRRRLRDGVLKIAYRFVDAFLAIGTANRNYYRSLGIDDSRIFDVPYVVDNARFVADAERAAPKRAATRQKYGLPTDAIVVLYVSKFIRRKHPDTVVRVVSTLYASRRSVVLFMVGSGEMEQELRDLAAPLPGGIVVFAGFVNQRELPEVYAASDIFVLPSENEPWGLVVNEVMCAAIPVVVSEELGCARDLVRHGINGYLIRAGDPASLSSALENLIADENKRREMGAAGRSIIKNWGFEECRQGITAALASVVRS